MTGKMALKNKKKNKQKSLRSNRGDSVTFSGRCKSLKMEDDVEFIELNPCITESREAIRQLYQGAVIASPAPSSCTFVSPDSEYGVDLENHPARGQKKKERDEKEKDTRLSPLIELSYASPSPFTTPTPPLSDDRSRPESPYRVACFKPEIKDEPEIVKRTPSPLAIPPDYAFRVSPQRRSPRMFNKRSPSPEWSQSSRKSPRKQLDEPFKVPSAPARPISLDAPGTSGFVASSSAGGGPDPSPSPSSDSGSTATSSFSSGSHLYHTSSSSSGSGSGSGGGSGPGSGASSISGSISIPDPSHSSSDRPSPVEKPEDFDMILDPFKVCTIKNFIQDRDYLEKLRKYLTFKLPYEKRSADMFEYYQGNDDEFSKNRLVQSLEYTFVDKLVPFMSYMFGFPLRKDKLTLSASKYSFTNYLLCHDDVYEDKRIAFVLYLSKKWKKEYGGTLDFFGTNKHNDPTKPITSIIPEYNRLIFFEISPITHHQVSEVIVPEHDRITINGWFHGVFPPAKIIRDPEPQISEIRPANVSDDHIYIDNWMHKMYFSKSRQMRIQALFKENGYVYLPGFMRKEKFKEVVKALREADGWMFIGPPNRRRYEVLPEDLLPNIVKDCLRFFICEAMFLTMFNFTGCKLHALAFAAPEVEIQLKFAKYRMDESPDAETAEDIECDTEILDIATAIERGEPIAANVLYGQFPPSPNSPEEAINF
ncbi:prolyl 3-hydroxylase OGFOD1 [Tetranychus urticae]|nr:prolyl 3-hydroxylase OGFOD1 [Tetranychus urticae]